MGYNVGWDPTKIAREWMNICRGFEGLNGLPFFAQTLWSVGPLPQLFTFGDSQYLFGNSNWGCTQDLFYYSGGGGGGSVKEPPKDEAELKLEKEKKAEKEAQKQKEKDDKEYAQKRLNEKFDKLKPLLVSYKESLDKLYEAETDETKKRELYDASRAIANCTSKATEANYNKMLEIYNTNKEAINTAKAAEISSKVTTAKNDTYKSYVTDLKSKIDSGDETFGILKKTDSGAIEWGKIGVGDDKKDIDIMELLSTWNSEYVSKGTHANLIMHIAEKRAGKTGTDKSNYDTLSNKLHEKLKTAAENIKEDKLSATTKEALQKAMEDFEKFDTVDKRFSTAQVPVGQNYSNAFENLYRAIRLAEAEVADKALEDAFDFLGEENPYKGKTTNTTAVKADLKSECRTTVQTVVAPVVPEPPKEQVIKIGGEEYKVITSGNDVKYIRTRDNKEFTKETLKNEIKVSDVTVNEDGSYSYKYNNETLNFDKDHATKPVEGQNNNNATEGKIIKIAGVEYKVTGTGNDVKYIKTSDNTEFTATTIASEIPGISDIIINSDGSYSYKYKNQICKFDKDHNPIEET